MTVEERIIDRIDLYLDEEAAGAAPSMTVLIADLSAAIRADERERLAKLAEAELFHDWVEGELGDREPEAIAQWLRSQTPPAGGG